MRCRDSARATPGCAEFALKRAVALLTRRGARCELAPQPEAPVRMVSVASGKWRPGPLAFCGSLSNRAMCLVF